MQVGSLVTWKYTDDRLFVVVTMVDNPFMAGASVGVMGVRSGIIVKVDFGDNVGYHYYRVRWFFANDRTHETVEFEDDLVTKEQKCKLEL